MKQGTVEIIFDVISSIADIITIVGLAWATIWSFLKREKTLIGFQLNVFLVKMVRLIVIVITGSLFYILWSIIIFPFTSLLFGLELSSGTIYWNNGKHIIQYVLSYTTSVPLAITFYWLAITIIWNSSFDQVIDFMNKLIPKNIRVTRQNRNKLEIISAKYGFQDKFVDVTEILKQMIVDNSLSVLASNDLAGDPLFGTPKKLTIEYKTDNYEKKSMEINEGEMLKIEVKK